MDASTIGIMGAVTTVVAVIITHMLNQRAGEKRATQVRDELIGRMDGLNTRVTEVKETLSGRISEVSERVTEIRTDLTDRIKEQGARLESQIGSSATSTREGVSAEIRVMKAEILARLPELVRHAGAEPKA